MSSNLQETANFVTFNEKIVNGELHFLCSGCTYTFLNYFREANEQITMHLVSVEATFLLFLLI